MQENKEELLTQLQELLRQKQSKAWYSERLGIPIGEVEQLLFELRQKEKGTPESGILTLNLISGNSSTIIERSQKVNEDKGTIESEVVIDFEPKNIDALYELHKIDKELYKISNYWSKLKSTGKFTSSVLATLIKKDSVDVFQKEFKDFIKGFHYNPEIVKIPQDRRKEKIALIIPKQDAHFNKFDIQGENDIDSRFNKSKQSILNMLLKASATNQINEVVYIIGSDQFNSEWTSLTTKGTPQQNILGYQDAFKKISMHEVDVIATLIAYSQKVKIVFLPGNHDEFVGWHLIDWLETYFRGHGSHIEFQSELANTKYLRYNNSAIMLNHGDDIKPADLAAKFPIGFKKEWSLCDHFYIFTGDKHHELSKDFNGIKFYQVPQLSNAMSKWDDKKGFGLSKAEMTAFVISSNNGMTDVYKDIM